MVIVVIVAIMVIIIIWRDEHQRTIDWYFDVHHGIRVWLWVLTHRKIRLDDVTDKMMTTWWQDDPRFQPAHRTWFFSWHVEIALSCYLAFLKSSTPASVGRPCWVGSLLPFRLRLPAFLRNLHWIRLIVVAIKRYSYLHSSINQSHERQEFWTTK